MLTAADRLMLSAAGKTAGASFCHALRLYLWLTLCIAAVAIPLGFQYGALYLASIIWLTRRAILFLYLPLFVFTPPASPPWRYFLAVPVITGLGGWDVYREGLGQTPDRFFIWSCTIFLLVLSFLACLKNRRRSQPSNTMDPALRRVIILGLLILAGLILRKIFPIAAPTAGFTIVNILSTCWPLGLLAAAVALFRLIRRNLRPPKPSEPIR